MTIHTDQDDVDVEIPMLNLSYLDLQDEIPIENDIILLGDFNAKAPGVTVGSYITMNSIAGIKLKQNFFYRTKECSPRLVAIRNLRYFICNWI